MQGLTGIIDICFRTTDLAAIEDGEYIPEKSKSLSVGLATAYSDIGSNLAMEYGLEKEHYALDGAIIERKINISGQTHFRGEIVSRGTLRIDGWVEGKITTEGDVIIGESGAVSAQIRARNIIVAGRVKGNLIPSCHVEIAAIASLEGDIQVG